MFFFISTRAWITSFYQPKHRIFDASKCVSCECNWYIIAYNLRLAEFRRRLSAKRVLSTASHCHGEYSYHSTFFSSFILIQTLNQARIITFKSVSVEVVEKSV